jgi:cell division control protein 7
MSTSADGDGDDRGRGDDEMASHFFYVEEDTGTPGIVAGEVTPEAERERERGTVDAMDEDDNPEVNFWMECIQDPDAAEGETGATAGGGEGEGQGEKNGEGADAHDPETTPKASRRPRPTSSGKRPRTHDQPTDADAGETERHVSDDERTFVVDDDESMDSDDSTDAEGGVSYHSGDSEEYEMKHRPWLERTAVKKDIVGLYNISGMWNGALGTYRYRVVDRLGEGTFSSVYLAYDELHNLYNNNYWTDKESTDDLDMLYETSSAHKVALKKILVTSSPSRIENELSILENLRGCRNVSPLISAFRDQDQVVIVLPFHRSDDFRYFYALMDPPKIKQYMTCLLRGLKDIHARGILHRDVKPANFLFDYERGDGLLVDFGLAERYNPPRRAACQHTPASRAHLHGSRTRTGDTAAVEQAVYDAAKRAKSGDGRIGFRQEDARPPIKTNRAGTRGFRAPEVLLKCPDQTVAIDIWSAGVMLMSILAHKFPIFNSADDIEALMEIAAIFGRKQMERCAFLHSECEPTYRYERYADFQTARSSQTSRRWTTRLTRWPRSFCAPTPTSIPRGSMTRRPKRRSSTSQRSTTRSTCVPACSDWMLPHASPPPRRCATLSWGTRTTTAPTSCSTLRRASAGTCTSLPRTARVSRVMGHLAWCQ